VARMRSVKPEFWSDLKLARLSRDARLLYIALWNHSDEWGRMHGDARFVKGHCLPYEDDLSLDDVDDLLDELNVAGRVVRYTHDGDPYLYLPNLGKHQRLEPEKVKSRLPEPPQMGGSENRADESEKFSDQTPPTEAPGGASAESSRSEAQSEKRADSSGKISDESEKIAVLHVAGSRKHVAGTPSPPAAAEPDGFAEFWQVYPRKVEKIAAKKAYRKALKAVSPEALLDGAQRYAATTRATDPKFVKYPAAWLNAGGWEDETAAPTNKLAAWLAAHPHVNPADEYLIPESVFR
jgi:hypothetical protein